MPHRIATAALLIVTSLASTAFAEGPAQPGKAAYVSNCASCHGLDGKGKGAEGMYFTPSPTDFTTAAFAKQSDAAVHKGIAEGKGNMPAFKMKLSDAAIDEVIAYLRTLAPAPAKKAAKPARKKKSAPKK